MPDLWIDLLGCLDLHSAAQAGADERSDAEDITTFDGASQQLQYHRVFGGQLLGQFIGAAQLTCPDKTVKSLHAVFAREGQAAEPVRYQSTRQHQGRSFASLTITAHQTRGVLASSSVSMHAVEDGPEYQDREPVPALLGEKHRAELDLIPWETRCADDLNAVTAGPPRLELWMRTPPVDGDLAFALTAYASDLTLIGTALRPLDGFNHSGNGTLVHLRGHLSYRVVSPAFPHRPLALVAATQSSVGARPLFWPRRCPHRGRHARRVVCTGGAAALSRRRRMRHHMSGRTSSRRRKSVRISHKTTNSENCILIK